MIFWPFPLSALCDLCGNYFFYFTTEITEGTERETLYLLSIVLGTIPGGEIYSFLTRLTQKICFFGSFFCVR